MNNQKFLKHKSLSSFIFYLTIVLLFLTFSFSITFAANWWDSSYSYRDVINVTTAWTLIGRGREGWAWTNAGRGTASDIINDFTSPSAFTPAYYSSTFIDNLLNDSDVSSLNSGVRLRRANETDGSDFQNVIWNFSTLTGWNWNFDSSFALSDYIVNSVNYGGTYDTRDANPFDDRRRIFTNAIGAHNNEEGFSYGNSECRGANTPTNYLWEYISECRSIPFTQVYVSPRIQQETPGIISDTTGANPLYTLSSQAQTCTPAEDGTCSFSWSVNATGNVGSLHNISVIAFSNISSINYSQSSNATINITNIVPPTVTLLTPLNNTKILNDVINFTWQVNDDSTTLNCTLYINDIVNQTTPCVSSTNTSLLISIQRGDFNWTIQVEDPTGIQVNSTTREFLKLNNYSSRIKKQIIFDSTDMYRVNLTITNFKTNLSTSYMIYEYINSNFTLGSPSQTINSTSLITGNFEGDLYTWNSTISAMNNRSISYLLSALPNTNYSLSEQFIIGLE